MNIAIVGTGYVGLVSGTCFAEMGVNVTCVDVNQAKIESLQKGQIPIYEPGLDEMVLRNQKEGRLKFTTDLASDTHIGSKFLYPGCGYGGSCFPKDVKALIKTAEKNGYKMGVLKAVEDVNEYQKTVLFNKLNKRFNGDLKGKTIAMWGLAFKPETDDMREATALVLIDLLTKAGANIRVYDPVAMEECKRRMSNRHPEQSTRHSERSEESSDALAITYCNDMYEALLDAEALLLVTEWKQFRMHSFGVMKKSMKNAIIIDGRNIYDAKELAEAGFEYNAIGC